MTEACCLLCFLAYGHGLATFGSCPSRQCRALGQTQTPKWADSRHRCPHRVGRGPGQHQNTGAGLAASSAASPRTDGHTGEQSASRFIWVYDRQMVPKSVFKARAPPHGLPRAQDRAVGAAWAPGRRAAPAAAPAPGGLSAEQGVPGQSRGWGPPGCQAAAPSSVSSNTGLSKQPSLSALTAAPAHAVPIRTSGQGVQSMAQPGASRWSQRRA